MLGVNANGYWLQHNCFYFISEAVIQFLLNAPCPFLLLPGDDESNGKY